MTDIFKNQMIRSNPGDFHFLVVPSDTEDFAVVPRAIYCLTAGTAQIVDAGDTVIGIPLTAGQIYVFRARRINATSTTGTYVGIY